MIYNLVLSIHVLVCIVLIVVVLMQSSKGGGLAGAFGGGGDQTVFGGHETATFLSKATTYLAVGFMVLSLVLAFLTSKRGIGRPESAIRQSLQQQGNVIPRGESVDDILGAALDSIAAPADTTQ
ncbi:MAG: preprotein translocase subunit SecG [Candidatus Latescibacterota bacterium]|nr:MAG: preprotein translocase subunit SecG [Candidatus Latescibacterota bacterium]